MTLQTRANEHLVIVVWMNWWKVRGWITWLFRKLKPPDLLSKWRGSKEAVGWGGGGKKGKKKSTWRNLTWYPWLWFEEEQIQIYAKWLANAQQCVVGNLCAMSTRDVWWCFLNLFGLCDASSVVRAFPRAHWCPGWFDQETGTSRG